MITIMQTNYNEIELYFKEDEIFVFIRRKISRGLYKTRFILSGIV